MEERKERIRQFVSAKFDLHCDRSCATPFHSLGVYIQPTGSDADIAFSDGPQAPALARGGPHKFPLLQELTHLINDRPTSSFVVLGDSGCGKSLFAIELCKEFWTHVHLEEWDRIPIYIYLPHYATVNNLLKQYFDGALAKGIDLQTAKSLKYLLVLDSYDELPSHVNIADQQEGDYSWDGHADQFQDVVVVTLTRKQDFTVEQRNHLFFFKAAHKEFFLCPFEPQQISTYIEGFVRELCVFDLEGTGTTALHLIKRATHGTNWEVWPKSGKEANENEYMCWFRVLPELFQLCKNPLLLSIILAVMPNMLHEMGSAIDFIMTEDRREKLQKIRLLCSTKTGIYDLFTQYWFKFQAKRILKSKEPRTLFDGIPAHRREPILINLFRIYAQNLAQSFLCSDVSKYPKHGSTRKEIIFKDTISLQESVHWTLMDAHIYPALDQEGMLEAIAKIYEKHFGLESALVGKENDNPTKVLKELQEITRALFPTEQDEANAESVPKWKTANLAAIRNGCLIQISEGRVKFMHRSLVVYFASKFLFEALELAFQLFIANDFGHIEGKTASMLIESRLRDPDILDELANRVRLHDEFTDLLLQVVRSSRTLRQIRTFASNAMTILNRGGYIFSGQDLHDVQVPEVDLSHAILDSCDFRGANLKHASLTNAYICGAQFQGANLKRVKFGQLPTITPPGPIRVIGLNSYRSEETGFHYWVVSFDDDSVKTFLVNSHEENVSAFDRDLVSISFSVHVDQSRCFHQKFESGTCEVRTLVTKWSANVVAAYARFTPESSCQACTKRAPFNSYMLHDGIRVAWSRHHLAVWVHEHLSVVELHAATTMGHVVKWANIREVEGLRQFLEDQTCIWQTDRYLALECNEKNKVCLVCLVEPQMYTAVLKLESCQTVGNNWRMLDTFVTESGGNTIYSIAFQPGTTTLFVGSVVGLQMVKADDNSDDIEKLSLGGLSSLRGNTSLIYGLAFNAAGSKMASVCDKRVVVWDLMSKAEPNIQVVIEWRTGPDFLAEMDKRLLYHSSILHFVDTSGKFVAFCPNARYFAAVVNENGAVKGWKLDDHEIQGSSTQGAAAVTELMAVSEDDSLVGCIVRELGSYRLYVHNTDSSRDMVSFDLGNQTGRVRHLGFGTRFVCLEFLNSSTLAVLSFHHTRQGGIEQREIVLDIIKVDTFQRSHSIVEVPGIIILDMILSGRKYAAIQPRGGSSAAWYLVLVHERRQQTWPVPLDGFLLTIWTFGVLVENLSVQLTPIATLNGLVGYGTPWLELKYNWLAILVKYDQYVHKSRLCLLNLDCLHDLNSSPEPCPLPSQFVHHFNESQCSKMKVSLMRSPHSHGKVLLYCSDDGVTTGWNISAFKEPELVFTICTRERLVYFVSAFYFSPAPSPTTTKGQMTQPIIIVLGLDTLRVLCQGAQKETQTLLTIPVWFKSKKCVASPFAELPAEEGDRVLNGCHIVIAGTSHAEMCCIRVECHRDLGTDATILNPANWKWKIVWSKSRCTQLTVAGANMGMSHFKDKSGLALLDEAGARGTATVAPSVLRYNAYASLFTEIPGTTISHGEDTKNETILHVNGQHFHLDPSSWAIFAAAERGRGKDSSGGAVLKHVFFIIEGILHNRRFLIYADYIDAGVRMYPKCEADNIPEVRAKLNEYREQCVSGKWVARYLAVSVQEGLNFIDSIHKDKQEHYEYSLLSGRMSETLSCTEWARRKLEVIGIETDVSWYSNFVCHPKDIVNDPNNEPNVLIRRLQFFKNFPSAVVVVTCTACTTALIIAIILAAFNFS